MKIYQYTIKCCFSTVLFALLVIKGTNAKAQIITTFAGNGTAGYSGDGGGATAAKINGSARITFDGGGSAYILDQGNFVIRKVDVTGVITTIAGNGTSGYSGDGGQATAAQFKNIGGGVFDAGGNFIVTDPYSDCVRKISTTGVITTIAGTGIAGFAGDGGAATAAKLNNPQHIAIDALGNILITDRGNFRIRKIDASGVITTFAGNGTIVYSGGSVTATAEGMDPLFICMYNNEIYYTHCLGNRVCKIDAAGIVTTVAGTGVAGFSGDGGLATLAQLRAPNGICTDTAGNIYISDAANFYIRKINKAGIISTIAGTGIVGYNGDGIPAITAKLAGAGGLAVNGGHLYICDAGNSRIRVIKGIVSVKDVVDGKNIRVYPNPAVDELMLEVQEGCNYSVHDIAGQVVKEGRLGKGTQTIRIDDMARGTYVISLIKDGVMYGTGCFVKN